MDSSLARAREVIRGWQGDGFLLDADDGSLALRLAAAIDEARLEKVAIVDKWIDEQRKEYPRSTARIFNKMLDELATSLRERGKV